MKTVNWSYKRACFRFFLVTIFRFQRNGLVEKLFFTINFYPGSISITKNKSNVQKTAVANVLKMNYIETSVRLYGCHR